MGTVLYISALMGVVILMALVRNGFHKPLIKPYDLNAIDFINQNVGGSPVLKSQLGIQQMQGVHGQSKIQEYLRDPQ